MHFLKHSLGICVPNLKLQYPVDKLLIYFFLLNKRILLIFEKEKEKLNGSRAYRQNTTQEPTPTDIVWTWFTHIKSSPCLDKGLGQEFTILTCFLVGQNHFTLFTILTCFLGGQNHFRLFPLFFGVQQKRKNKHNHPRRYQSEDARISYHSSLPPL